MLVSARRFMLLCGTAVCVSLLGLEVGRAFPIHISTPHITIPHVNIGPVSLTPVGPIPKPALPVVQNTVNAGAQAAGAAVHGVATVVGSAVQAAPQVQIVGIIAGKESLGSAATNVVKGPGVVIASVGQGVSETNAAITNVPIVAAQSIAGDTGKTTLTIVTGPSRLSVDFEATAVIQAGGVLQGQNPDMLIAEPLAAAIRSAQLQFQNQAQPLPADVKAKLAGAYPQDVLDAARWTVGSISISVPDVVNKARKIFAGVDNAVTVGNITVFEVDPGQNYHWWAHEMEHQVQYKQWGIDSFALKYMTGCHQVESDAETKAQQVIPQIYSTPLAC